MKHEINVPEGCKVVSVEIISVETTDKMVVVKFEKEEPEFKENDIVYTEFNNHPCISIIQDASSNYNSIKTKCSYNIYKCELDTNVIYTYDTIRLATESEKQLLFDKLKEKCLMFDGENIVRWRDKIGGHYYCLSSSRVDTRAEEHFFSDNENYSIGNYFPTKELAEQFKKQYIDLLNNFHKNL